MLTRGGLMGISGGGAGRGSAREPSYHDLRRVRGKAHDGPHM
jgi:hypothetical protein